MKIQNLLLVLIIFISCPFTKGQLDIKRYPPEFQKKFIESLANICAAEDIGKYKNENILNYDEEEKIDWIDFFSQAKYKRWEAEGDNSGNPVRIKHESGNIYYDGDTIGWRSGTGSVPGDLIIYGPGYWQSPRYSLINNSYNIKPIVYSAAFRIKIDTIPLNPLPVCSLLVTLKFDNDPGEVVLEEKLITSDRFYGTNYTDIILNYSYYKFCQDNAAYSPNIPDEPCAANGNDKVGRVQFKVVWLGEVQVFVDYIEVYDKLIWNNHFTSPLNYEHTVNTIYKYCELIKNQSKNFNEKAGYYIITNPPCGLDDYEAKRKVLNIIDSLNTGGR